ncbi:MAG: hypothetical protein FJ006_10785 [Chloroflexi bacterium]|nr:hypothetical protein [Chloroflexota bacterium]
MRQEESFKVLANAFAFLGGANYIFLYPEHYRSADRFLKEGIVYAFQAAAIRRLEEMGCTGWQIGETSEGVGEFHTRVVKIFKVAVPTLFFPDSTLTVENYHRS